MTIWNKQSNESGKSYFFFLAYLDMGACRSLAKVVRAENKKPSYIGQLNKWSGKYNWVARTTAYDEYQFEEDIRGRVKTYGRNVAEV